MFKDIGLPDAVTRRFDLAYRSGTHALGHTRMATESAATTEHSHPFSTGRDLCLVHNGSLSNHNRLRRSRRRAGIRFATDNDTEVAAGYLTWRFGQGMSLPQALGAALADLDGFYAFAVGTTDGFAILRDRSPASPQSSPKPTTGSRWRPNTGDCNPARRGRCRDLGAEAGDWLFPAAPVIEFDLARSSVRALNDRLHRLIPQTNELYWRVLNPNGAHAVAIGITEPVQIEIKGHVGYYRAGMNAAATVVAGAWSSILRFAT